jgi:hypothetical protein
MSDALRLVIEYLEHHQALKALNLLPAIIAHCDYQSCMRMLIDEICTYEYAFSDCVNFGKRGMSPVSLRRLLEDFKRGEDYDGILFTAVYYPYIRYSHKYFF